MRPYRFGPLTRRLFIAVQETTVPRSARFTESQRRESLRLVEEALSEKPDAVGLKLALFLVVIDLTARWRTLRGFRHLDRERRLRILGSFHDSRRPILRKGFWGLNTLTRLGVYGQPSVYPEIHYRPAELRRA